MRPFVAVPDEAPASSPPQHLPPSGGAALRPYLMTGGRVRPAVDSLEIEAQVMTTAHGLAARPQHTFEYRDLVTACEAPISIAEAAARLGLQVNVIRVLVGDLVGMGHVALLRPEGGLAHDVETIEKVIRGLQSLS